MKGKEIYEMATKSAQAGIQKARYAYGGGEIDMPAFEALMTAVSSLITMAGALAERVDELEAAEAARSDADSLAESVALYKQQ